MSYLYLVMSGILFGGVVFGAKVLYLMGASLFEVLFYPNLISVLLVWGFARRDFVVAHNCRLCAFRYRHRFRTGGAVVS